MMAKDPAFLRKRFLDHITTKWFCYNTYDRTWKDLSAKSGVYIFVAFNYILEEREIVYVGSSVNLRQRYKIHKVPTKIHALGQNIFSILFFIEMEKGFYDYERKLINKLKPSFNVQHKNKDVKWH